MPKKPTVVTGPVADQHVVRLLTNYLVKSYQAFINDYPGGVDYVDGFMAAHNFHRAVIEDLAGRTGQADVLFPSAAATFAEAMERAAEGDRIIEQR